MATAQDLSTPRWPAEQRAWLLIYRKRLFGKHLTNAFNRQFPERAPRVIIFHAAILRECKDDVQSQLQDLARQFAWYEDPPREGERKYKSMKTAESKWEARIRNKKRKKQIRDVLDAIMDSTNGYGGADAVE